MSTYQKRILSAFIALFALLGIFVYLYHRNSIKSQEIALYEQNWKAANDTIEYYKLKNGEILAEKQSYILSEADMRTQLEMSKEEMTELKKKLSSALAQVAKVKTVVRIDSLYIESEPEIYEIDTIAAPFAYKDDWLNIEGAFNYGSGTAVTSIYNIETNVPLTVGISEDYSYFVSTSNPYVTITDITSVVNKKQVKTKKHWGVGVNAGFGIQYGLSSKKVDWGPQVGIGINYNF
jgi:hypothetical protein